MNLDDLPELAADVLVVGAGPTGLMASLVLTRLGVNTITVDTKAGPTKESRALALQARSLEIYEQLGLGEQVVAQRTPARRVRVGYLNHAPSGSTVAIEELQQGQTRFPGLHIFEQSKNEQLLGEALAEAGGTVRWCHRLVDLQQDPLSPNGTEGYVRALVESPDGLLRIQPRWCIGADGATSLVRRLLDIPFEGVTDPGSFWVADVQGVQGFDDESINVRLGDPDILLGFPMGPAHHRLVGMIRDDATPTADSVLPGVCDRFGLSYQEVDWFAHYRIHHRVAASFGKGRCFLAGDAAHVHSPVGGQGMNTGLQDAHNLALKLRDVLLQNADPASLDEYERERRPVAQHLVSVTDRAFGLVASQSPPLRLIRKQVLSRAFRLPSLATRSRWGHRAGGYVGQIRIRYRNLMPTSGDDGVTGRRLPPIDDGANQLALQDFSWQVHHYAGAGAQTNLWDDAGGLELAGASPIRVLGPRTFPMDPTGRLRADRWYLIRPDGFVAGAVAPGATTAIMALLPVGLDSARTGGSAAEGAA